MNVSGLSSPIAARVARPAASTPKSPAVATVRSVPPRDCGASSAEEVPAVAFPPSEEPQPPAMAAAMATSAHRHNRRLPPEGTTANLFRCGPDADAGERKGDRPLNQRLAHAAAGA